MKIPKIITCAFLTICLSCNNQTPSSSDITATLPYPHVINIKEALDKPVSIKLSEIADSIRYVVLSKDKTVLTKRFLYLEMAEDDIFIQIGGSLIFRFDSKGTFLNNVGEIGRGPEEYLDGSSFSINPLSRIVYVYRNFLEDFVSYDFNGTFLKKLPFDLKNNIGSFKFISDSTFFIYPVYSGIAPDDMFLCGIFNLNGKIIKSIKHPAKNIPADFNASRFIVGGPWPIDTYFRGELISICDFDTVHKVNESSIYNAFIFNWENLPRPKTFEEKYYIGGRPKNAISNPGKLYETPSKAFILINDRIKSHIIEFNKSNSSARSMTLSDPDNLGFINDLDNGINFYPSWTTREGNIWINSIEAIDFINLHKSLSKQDFDENLSSFLSGLQIDDNTVLEFVYIKNSNAKENK
jgi:hypothetical protein